MKTTTHSQFLLILAGTLISASAVAQSADYRMTWNNVSGDGVVASAGNFTLSGTIGQPVAGLSIAGNYSLAAGFWAAESGVVQTTGAPRLSLTRSGPNVILSWPATVTGFTLQSASTFGGKPVWTPVVQLATLVNGQYQVTVPIAQGSKFFRLMKP